MQSSVFRRLPFGIMMATLHRAMCRCGQSKRKTPFGASKPASSPIMLLKGHNSVGILNGGVCVACRAGSQLGSSCGCFWWSFSSSGSHLPHKHTLTASFLLRWLPRLCPGKFGVLPFALTWSIHLRFTSVKGQSILVLTCVCFAGSDSWRSAVWC